MSGEKRKYVFGHSNSGVVDSNPNQCMDVCLRFSFLLSVLSYVGNVRRADPPYKKSYQLFVIYTVSV
jgi:hypothetical protein